MLSGTSIDWAHATQNINLAYAFELRPHGEGFGVLLPTDQIIPNSVEFIDGLRALVEQGQALNYL